MPLWGLLLRGAVAVQRLIDSCAYISWTENNGLEMVAEFQREVGEEQYKNHKMLVNKASVSLMSHQCAL